MLGGVLARGVCPLVALFACAQASGLQPSANQSGRRQSAAQSTLEVREHTFRFDGDVILSPEIGFRMRRPSASVDSLGHVVEIDEARFGPDTTIASDVTVQDVRAVSTSTTILCSGVDRDGQTPLLVVRDVSLRVIDVFAGANDAVVVAEQTGVGRSRTSLGSAGQIDLMGGAVPERRYDPKGGAICHGLIVLVCTVAFYDEFTIGAWPTRAIALIASEDRGQTWQVLFEDAPIQEGLLRLREWSLQNWSPVQEAARPTEAWFVATDYRAKPGCDGGIVCAVRAVRPDVDAPWEISAAGRIYETPTVAMGQHAHAAAVFPGPDGPCALVGIGDSLPFNRIVRLTATEPSGVAAPWAAEETFHGSEGTAGNQFVGCATIGATGRVILGSDLSDEQIMLVDGNAPSAAHRSLFGGTWSDGLSSQVFMIRSPRPECGGPYCATYDPQTNSTTYPMLARRLLYSDDGIRWAQVFAPGANASWTAALHGDHIYIDGESSSGARLRRTTIPTLVTTRPLHVGPGVMQRLSVAPIVSTGPGGTITALSRNADGFWEDAGIVLDPQPPSTGRVWKIIGNAGTTDTRIADIRLMDQPTFGHVLDTKRMILRFWTMNARSDISCTARFEIRATGGSIQYSRTLKQECVGEWRPVTIAGELVVPEGQRPMMRVRSGSTVGVAQAFYLALDTFAEGAGYSGYPGGPDLSFGVTGTAQPDEHAAITGLDLRNQWTVTLAGRVPDDGWDDAVRSKSELVWPLVSLWCSEQERLVLVANPDRQTMEARLIMGTKTVATYTLDSLVWTRGSSVLVSIARIGAGAPMQITVAACGMPAREMALTSGPTGSTLNSPVREIRFDDGTDVDGIGADVRCAPMLWFGGSVQENRALSVQDRLVALRTLDFLSNDP